MIVLDTSGIVAAYNRRESEHIASREVLIGTSEPMVVSPLVLAEVEYLASKYLGTAGSRTVLTEVEQLATVATFGNEDLRSAVRTLSQYGDLTIGLTDAANVVIAGRYKATTLLTLDDHYRAVRPAHGEAFILLPV